MFGGGSKASKPDPSVSQEAPGSVIELSDSEPELTTLPSSPAEVAGTATASEDGSLTTLEGKDGA